MTTRAPGRWFGVAAGLLAGGGRPPPRLPTSSGAVALAAPGVGRGGPGAGCGRPPAELPTSSGAMACAAPVVAWAGRCAARQGMPIPEVLCPEDRMVLVSLGGNPGVRVELRPADAHGFRRVGAWGLSP